MAARWPIAGVLITHDVTNMGKSGCFSPPLHLRLRWYHGATLWRFIADRQGLALVCCSQVLVIGTVLIWTKLSTTELIEQVGDG